QRRHARQQRRAPPAWPAAARPLRAPRAAPSHCDLTPSRYAPDTPGSPPSPEEEKTFSQTKVRREDNNEEEDNEEDNEEDKEDNEEEDNEEERKRKNAL